MGKGDGSVETATQGHPEAEPHLARATAGRGRDPFRFERLAQKPLIPSLAPSSTVNALVLVLLLLQRPGHRGQAGRQPAERLPGWHLQGSLAIALEPLDQALDCPDGLVDLPFGQVSAGGLPRQQWVHARPPHSESSSAAARCSRSSGRSCSVSRPLATWYRSHTSSRMRPPVRRKATKQLPSSRAAMTTPRRREYTAAGLRAAIRARASVATTRRFMAGLLLRLSVIIRGRLRRHHQVAPERGRAPGLDFRQPLPLPLVALAHQRRHALAIVQLAVGSEPAAQPAGVHPVHVNPLPSW